MAQTAKVEPKGLAPRTPGMVLKSLAGILVVAALSWGIANVSASSGAPERSSLLTKKRGVECVKDRGGRQCRNGIAVESDDLALSPDGKNGYIINSGYDDDEREYGEVWIYDRNPATGSLVQKQGTAGCIAQGRSKGCARGRALLVSFDIAISPDGRNVYASTAYSIAIFDRDPSTGELTQPAGAAGCITSSRKKYPTCSYGRGIGGPGIAISPDGLNVYVGSHPLTVFDRDPATGALTQKPVSEGAKPTAADVIVSPDGKNVYVSTYEPDRVVTFDRNPATGALTRVPGRAGCISEKGKGNCRRGHEFSHGFDLAISPDGRNVYGATSRGLGQGDYGVVTILDRLPDGTLAQKKGRAGCFAMFGGEDEGCASTESLSEVEDITVSADGKRVYVFGYFGLYAILVRHPSGRLTEGPGD